MCSLAGAWKLAKDTRYYVDPTMLVMAVMTLCRAEKSVEVDDPRNVTAEQIKQDVLREVPDYARDIHTGPVGRPTSATPTGIAPSTGSWTSPSAGTVGARGSFGRTGIPGHR